MAVSKGYGWRRNDSDGDHDGKSGKGSMDYPSQDNSFATGKPFFPTGSSGSEWGPGKGGRKPGRHDDKDKNKDDDDRDDDDKDDD